MSKIEWTGKTWNPVAGCMETTGTGDMVKKANRAGLRVTIVAKPGDML